MASCWNLLSKYGDFGNASDVGIAWDARERERERGKYGDFGNASDVVIAWDARERERERERGHLVCASDALVLVY